MGIRQAVDKSVQGVSTLDVIVDAWWVDLSRWNKNEKKTVRRTCSRDEIRVKLSRKQRIGQVSEELLQQPCHTVDIMIEALWVGEVDSR